MLFTSLVDVIEENEQGHRKMLENDLTRQIDDKYPDVRKFRIEDSKPFSDVETLADRFQVLGKDIDYGYSYTCHKAQGSTIDVTFIDDTDFDRIKDRWNFRVGMMERRLKEKNQLRYVAYTRAKSKIYSLTKF